MVMTELEKLRRLSDYADQISNIAADGEDARKRIDQLIQRAEEDIRTKSLEIEVRQSQIDLLRHIAGVLPRAAGNTVSQINQAAGGRNGQAPVSLKAEAAEK